MIVYIKHTACANRPTRLSRAYKSPNTRTRGQQMSADSIDLTISTTHQNLSLAVQQPPQLQTTILVQENVTKLLNQLQLQAETCVSKQGSTLDRATSNITVLNDFNKDVNFLKEILPAAERHAVAAKKRIVRGDKAARRKSLATRSRFFNMEPNITTMLNPDCFVQIILDFIYEQVGMDKSVNLDLCDANGVMMRLNSYNKHDMATTLFEENKVYYVVQYELYEDGSYKLLLPVLRDLTDEDSEVYANIQKNYTSRKSIASNLSITKSRARRMSSAIL